MKPVTVYISILFFVLSPILSKSQSRDFEKIFLEVTQDDPWADDTRNFKHIKTLNYSADTLPQWFFNLPNNKKRNVYAIGISDPDLPYEEAMEQAIYRAKSLAVLFHDAQIQFYRDSYSFMDFQDQYDQYSERFDTYFRFLGGANVIESNFQIVQQYFTKYHEALVLIQFSPSKKRRNLKNSDYINTIGTSFLVEMQMDEVFESQGEQELNSTYTTADGKELNSNYTFREKGNRTLSISEHFGEPHVFPLHPYSYSTPWQASNSDPLVSYNGLWSIFIKSFIFNLSVEFEQSSIKIKTLEEIYNTQMRTLNREIAIAKRRLMLNGIDFEDNNLIFQLNLLSTN